MKKLTLNFICKNESHIVTRMLDSVRSKLDCIVAVDTGSTDNTIEIINEYGKKFAIPTFVYERPFDNFGNSRNYALERLYEIVKKLDWCIENVWGIFIDCDEILFGTEKFNKDALDKDIYWTTIRGEEGSDTRQILFHLSKHFWWEGPIHEKLIWDDPNITKGFQESLTIHYEPKGASWKGNLEEKFLKYARLLTKYIEEGHEEFWWVFHAGTSYDAAACYCPITTRKKEWLLSAKKYYAKAVTLHTPSIFEKTLVYRKIVSVGIELGESWPELQQILFNAYKIDIRRCEAIAQVITYLMNHNKWASAYIFSLFSITTWHGKNVLEQNVYGTEDNLYQWKLVLYHSICCYKSGRKEEATKARKELKKIIFQKPEFFTDSDLVYIHSNKPFYLTLREWNPWEKKNLY